MLGSNNAPSLKFTQLLLLALALLVSAAAACSCIAIAFETVQDRVAYALQNDAFVFHGTVVNVTSIDDPNSPSYNGVLVGVRLHAIFRDDNGPAAQLNIGDVATFVTARDSAACGITFAVDEKWVVGTYRPAGSDASVAYSANLCDVITCRLNGRSESGFHSCESRLQTLMNVTNGGRRRDDENQCLLPEGCGAASAGALMAAVLVALLAALF